MGLKKKLQYWHCVHFITTKCWWLTPKFSWLHLLMNFWPLPLVCVCVAQVCTWAWVEVDACSYVRVRHNVRPEFPHLGSSVSSVRTRLSLKAFNDETCHFPRPIGFSIIMMSSCLCVLLSPIAAQPSGLSRVSIVSGNRISPSHG